MEKRIPRKVSLGSRSTYRISHHFLDHFFPSEPWNIQSERLDILLHVFCDHRRKTSSFVLRTDKTAQTFDSVQ